MLDIGGHGVDVVLKTDDAGGERSNGAYRYASAKPTGGRALRLGAYAKVHRLLDGRASIDGLLPGTWGVSIHVVEFESDLTTVTTKVSTILGPEEVVVKVGETTEVNFRDR